jgi:hypothetical protein
LVGLIKGLDMLDVSILGPHPSCSVKFYRHSRVKTEFLVNHENYIYTIPKEVTL